MALGIALFISNDPVVWFLDHLWQRKIALLSFLFVLVYFAYYIVRATRESKACSAWVRQPSVRREASQIVSQLALFRDEAERWRTQGVAVPMTDYSDRIDSFIEGLADHLHSAVNLFLIVGLAGTFFGMAAFAQKVPGLGAASANEVVDALGNALGTSFPVGFLGLLLTVVANPIASLVESRLRESAKDAINHALRMRTAVLSQEGSNTLLAVLRKLPENIANAIAVSQTGLVAQLEPLLRLPEAIKSANEESLVPLRILFEESRKEWKDTVTKLSQQSKRMADAIERLEQPIVALTGKIDQVSNLVVSIEEVINRVLANAGKTSETIQQLQQQVEATVQSMQSSAEQLRGIPDLVRQDLSRLNEDVVAAIRAYYEGLGTSYVAGVRDLAVAASGDITTSAQSASAMLTGAANSLRVVADTFAPDLQSAVKAGADQLHSYLSEFNTAFQQHFPAAVDKLQASLATASGEIETARGVLEAMAQSANLAANSAKAWSEMDAALVDMNKTLQSTSKELKDGAKIIHTSAESYKTASGTLDSSVKALEKTIQNTPIAPPGKKRSLLDRILGTNR